MSSKHMLLQQGCDALERAWKKARHALEEFEAAEEAKAEEACWGLKASTIGPKLTVTFVTTAVSCNRIINSFSI